MFCTFYTKGFVFSTLLFNIIISVAQVAHADDHQNAKTTEATSLHKIDNDEKSDMLMVPNDYRSIALLRPDSAANLNPLRAHQFQPAGLLNTPFSARSFALPPPPPPLPPQLSQSQSQSPLRPPADTHKQAAQNYFPSFLHNAPPLGHSRPYLTNPENAAINKFANIQHAENAAAVGLQSQSQSHYDSVLGSGDFGVLRGGTFYPDDEMPYHLDEHANFDPYYGGDANNGHGRPSGDGFVQTYTYPEEQFANFRDFADINTPADTAFSQFAVVYASKNATKAGAAHTQQPKNIFEKLELLDKQAAMEEKKRKKQSAHSKAKSKLNKAKLEEKLKKSKSIQNQQNLDNEPLLAVS